VIRAGFSTPCRRCATLFQVSPDLTVNLGRRIVERQADRCSKLFLFFKIAFIVDFKIAFPRAHHPI
jgi:hypothetical protein